MYNFTESIKPMSSIKAGDTIEYEGVHKTVCSKDISKDSFMGVSIFGSSYIHGRQQVKKINIHNGLPK